MRCIFFDLDGTLIDSRDRLYKLFCDIVGSTMLSFDQYWDLKRDMKDHQWILKYKFNYSQVQIDSFVYRWMEMIEAPDYIAFDKPFEFTIATLERLRKQMARLYVVTARQSDEMAKDQLTKLGLISYFDDIFVTKANITKSELILRSGIRLSKNDYFVGDTGMDIRAGQELGLTTVAVLSGFRDRGNLEKYSPDLILDNISALNIVL